MSETKALDTLDALTNLQFLFVTGKGGVGKSTCAGLMGVHAANRGRHALIVLPQTSHNTPSLFGRTLSTTPQVVYTTDHGSLSLVVVDPESAMREYCGHILHSQMLTNALFHPKVAGGFLLGIPGLSDWALLGKSWAWTPSGTFALPKGERRHDLVIFDAPASGDGTKMLKVPHVILDLTPFDRSAPGRLREDARLCKEMLSDARRSAVLLVTLAEDLAITETDENLRFIEGELGFPVGPLVLNRLVAPLFSEQDQAELSASLDQLNQVPGALPVHADYARLVQAGLRYAARQMSQHQQIQRLMSWGRPFIQVPEMSEEFGDIAALARVTARLGADPSAS
ncbi:MAG TPA: ArsA-related P-loop ATPase, partial [Polyangiaceae bacterium]|nr:ArsA-related P-loop ATPase [Polyangiaceae bacterium]